MTLSLISTNTTTNIKPLKNTLHRNSWGMILITLLNKYIYISWKKSRTNLKKVMRKVMAMGMEMEMRMAMVARRLDKLKSNRRIRICKWTKPWFRNLLLLMIILTILKYSKNLIILNKITFRFLISIMIKVWILKLRNNLEKPNYLIQINW